MSARGRVYDNVKKALAFHTCCARRTKMSLSFIWLFHYRRVVKISAAGPTWISLINHELSNWSARLFFIRSVSPRQHVWHSTVPSVLHRARQDIVWTSLLLQLQKANNAVCYYPLTLHLLFPGCLMNIKWTKLTSVTLLLHSHGARSPEIDNKVATVTYTLLGFEAA